MLLSCSVACGNVTRPEGHGVWCGLCRWGPRAVAPWVLRRDHKVAIAVVRWTAGWAVPVTSVVWCQASVRGVTPGRGVTNEQTRNAYFWLPMPDEECLLHVDWVENPKVWQQYNLYRSQVLDNGPGRPRWGGQMWLWHGTGEDLLMSKNQH